MKYFIIFLLLSLIARIALDIIKIKRRKSRKKNDNDVTFEYIDDEDKEYQEENYPYHKQNLLTKNEYYFYKKLLPLIDALHLQILTKIRLADILEVDSGMSKGEWHRYFNRIKSKHVDFAIVDNMRVVLLIELDDSSHDRQDRSDRDTFINNALLKAGYVVVRTYGDTKIIQQALFDNGYSLK